MDAGLAPVRRLTRRVNHLSGGPGLRPGVETCGPRYNPAGPDPWSDGLSCG